MSDADYALLICAAFFGLLVLVALIRVLLRGDPPKVRRFRVGVFVERERDEPDLDDDLPTRWPPKEPPK